MLNSYTPTLEHNYAIRSRIIDITDDETPASCAHAPTLVDTDLGLLTLFVIALTIHGVRRARRWVQPRAVWPGWRFGLRLLSQTTGPAFVVLVFRVVPSLEDNPTISVDVLGFWPAAAVLLGASGVVVSS